MTAGSLVRSMTWGRQRFEFELTVEQRRDLKITVHPDLRVTVRAPESKSLELIERRIGAKRAWIAKQLREFEQYHPLSVRRQYVSGETHWYLGRQYVLRVEAGSPSVRCAAGRMTVAVTRPESASSVRSLLDEWYADRAKQVFSKHVAEIQSRSRLLKNRPIQIRVRRMARRWGSCTPAGTITLNPRLVQAPSVSIQYVVAHELCHLLIHDHSPRFFRQLERWIPDWEKRRSRLNRLSVAH